MKKRSTEKDPVPQEDDDLGEEEDDDEEDEEEEDDYDDEDETLNDAQLNLNGATTSNDATASNSKKNKSRLKKKTKGRVKIKMEFIENKIRRYTTFSKRKTGIMKKAYELSTLTGTQVMLLVASETGHVYTFATDKLQPMITSEAGKSLIQSCLSYGHDEDDPNASNTSGINNNINGNITIEKFSDLGDFDEILAGSNGEDDENEQEEKQAKNKKSKANSKANEKKKTGKQTKSSESPSKKSKLESTSTKHVEIRPNSELLSTNRLIAPNLNSNNNSEPMHSHNTATSLAHYFNQHQQINSATSNSNAFLFNNQIIPIQLSSNNNLHHQHQINNNNINNNGSSFI